MWLNSFFCSANGVIKGGIGGIAMVSATQKVWRVSQAIGDIAFAYPFASVLLEIEVIRACYDAYVQCATS
jgi:hypothetical protein